MMTMTSAERAERIAAAVATWAAPGNPGNYCIPASAAAAHAANVEWLVKTLIGYETALRRIADINCYCHTGYSSPCGCGRKAVDLAEEVLEPTS